MEVEQDEGGLHIGHSVHAAGAPTLASPRHKGRDGKGPRRRWRRCNKSNRRSRSGQSRSPEGAHSRNRRVCRGRRDYHSRLSPPLLSQQYRYPPGPLVCEEHIVLDSTCQRTEIAGTRPTGPDRAAWIAHTCDTCPLCPAGLSACAGTDTTVAGGRTRPTPHLVPTDKIDGGTTAPTEGAPQTSAEALRNL